MGRELYRLAILPDALCLAPGRSVHRPSAGVPLCASALADAQLAGELSAAHRGPAGQVSLLGERVKLGAALLG
jgi:hypothetical protein